MTTTSASDSSVKRPLLARRAANTVRFSLMNLFIISGIASMAAGGGWLWYGLLMTFFLAGFVEEWIGDASTKEEMPPVWYMDLMLWLTLPLLVMAALAMLNTIVAGGIGLDPVVALVGFDGVASRAATNWMDVIGGLVSLGMFFGVGGFVVAHELVHRTTRPFSMFVGRCLLALAWDTGFAIEHVYGHHKTVGTEHDPATARRGEYIVFFVVRSTIGQFKSAMQFEKARLKRRGIPSWQIWRNRFWRGQFMTLVVIAVYFWLAGPIGIVYSAVSAAIAKLYLEMVNYIEHYGLVRIPGQRIEPRHSWDSHRRISNGVLYQLPYHSNHHTFATKPFWELQQQPNREAPMLPMGYLPTIFMSFFPQFWWVVSNALLADWDRRLASPEEREYLKKKGLLLG